MSTLFRTGKGIDPEPPGRPPGVASRNGSSSSKMGTKRTSQSRLEVRREFLRTTTKGTQDEVFTNPETLPSMEVAYKAFQRTYPNFSETWVVDDLRDREYFHLEESQHVCMDYCGFGLFSYYQQIVNKSTSSFGLAYISANLPTHALYGAADEGTVEFYIRKRVMDYLNINDTEYSMVFTASRGSAFKLLAESYPFHQNPKLLTVYDFESQAVRWMADCAKQKGAKIMSASFKWPSLRIGTGHLKKLLQEKKKKGESAKGLFVFPVQSRMTGARYSYQWMSEAQHNNWHVLLDASSLGPKDMDSLGLSLFRPDFIVSSFYKVFGTDPTGFGCLFIKNTVIHSLQNSSRARAVGMVRIVSLSNFTSDGPEVKASEDDDEVQHNEDSLISFSGPYFTAGEPETKVNDEVKESNHRAWKSWKRRGKMAQNSGERSVRSTGSNGRTDKVSGIGGGGASKVEFVVQPTTSRHYSDVRETEIVGEQPNRGSETGHSQELTRSIYETSENEIQELEGDQVSEFGNSRWLTNSQWRSQERGFETQEDYQPIEFQSLAGKGISPIQEVDVEDQEVEEPWESERFSKSIDTANGSGGVHMVLSDHSQDVGANETDEEAVDPERNSVNDLAQFDAEDAEDSGRMKWGSSVVEESQQGSGSDIKDTGSEEIPESDLTAKRHQRAVNNGSQFENSEGSSDFLLSGELSNAVVKRNELTRSVSEPGSRSSVKGMVHSFERRASFERLTGKQLSDFQEIGVRGLVQKFQGLHNEFHKEFEDTVESKLDVVGDDPGHGIFETASHSPAAGGNVKHNVDIKASANEGDCNLREGDPSSMENKPVAESENAPMDPLREVSLVDECERSGDLNIEHMPTGTAVHSLHHSSSFSGPGRTPHESGEDNLTTIRPSRTTKNSTKRVSEAVIEGRASGSHEHSDRETSSAHEREHVATKDGSSFPDKRFRIEHAGEEERLSKPSRSPSIKLDNRLPSTVYQTTTPNRPSQAGSSTDDASFDIANLHHTKDPGLENGRSDLRSNRTLSRNVDFEDEMYLGRPSYLSEMFESGRLGTALAEDSDEESFFQSQHYSGSLHGSRYPVDDLEPDSYREGEDGDTEDEYEDIPEAELQEDQGGPIISCKGLDFADSLGLTKLNYRLRYLINWLVNSLLKLRHPGPNQGIPLVRIYGPKVKYDRGAAVSFNIFDWKGLLIQPVVVQRLADRCNISLGVGRLCNIVDPDMSPDFMAEKESLLGVDETNKGGADSSPQAGKLDCGKSGGAGDPLTIPVVTAAMGFVSSFEDIYKLWSFLAKFLDADYVSKEVLRYHSLNQQIMVM